MKMNLLPVLTLFLPFTLLPAKELYPAGDFEGNSTKPLHIMRSDHSSGKRKIPQKGTVTERIQNEKAFSGKQSLLLESTVQGSHSLNLHKIKVTPGKKYEFSWRYFIAERAGEKFSVSGRIIFWNGDKALRPMFPGGDGTPGKWHQVKVLFYPRSGADSFSLTVWVGNGTYKVYLDDLRITEFDEEKSPVADSNTFLLKSDGTFTVWKQSGYRRIDAFAVPGGLKKADAVKLTSAANEMEPFQLALFPKKELKDVTVSFSDLKGKSGIIPAAAQSFGVLRYVPMRNPNNPTLKGEIADPVVDERFAVAPAGRNTVFFIRIFAPKGTKPGLYKGAVTLKAGSKVLAEVPVELTVRNFTLPDAPKLAAFFYGAPGMTTMRYKDSRGSQAVRADLLKIYGDHRISGNQCIAPPDPKYEIRDGRLTVTDWSEFDAGVKELYAAGMRSFPVPFMRLKGANGGWYGGKAGPKIFGRSLFSKEGREFAGDYARQFHEHWLKTAPPGAQYYAYIYDEVPASAYAKLNEFTDEVLKRAPGFRFFVTHCVDPEIRNVSVFCVPFSPGNVKPELERKEKEYWYYNWTQPLDHRNYIKNRLYAWQVVANGGRGALKWDTASVPAKGVSPWTDLEKCHGNGEATTIFPAEKKGGALVPTLRLAQVREAIDDADYLLMLRDKVESKFPGQGMKYLLSRIKDVIPELPFGFTNDSELLYRVRDRIGDELENFDKAPVVLVTSTPLCYAATELSEVEIQVRGPAGAAVEIGGVSTGVLEGKVFSRKAALTKFGTNIVPVRITEKGKSKTFEMVFTLKRDPNLKKLETLVKQREVRKLDNAEYRVFLKRSASGAYTSADRARCAKLVEEAGRGLLASRLAELNTKAPPLVSTLYDRAKLMFENQLYGRAEYYLDLAGEFAKVKLPPKSKMKIVPGSLAGNPGWHISNGLVEFTLLELGGRIISFKVNGMECFRPGDLSQVLPLKIRAGQLHEELTHFDLPALGGYEDAGREVLPESAVDWDISVKEISDRRIALEASMLMKGGMFKISRIMSIVPGKPELKIDYTISNVFPTEFKSDDPSSYQFDWRGRLSPRIGIDSQSDAIEVPTKKPLKATLFDAKNPVFYEERSVPLTESRLGSFNAEKKAGFTWKFDDSVKYAYLWFNSKGDHNGKNKLYTLEIFRSFYGNKPGIPGNTPFYVEPGQSVSFSMSFTGRTQK